MKWQKIEKSKVWLFLQLEDWDEEVAENIAADAGWREFFSFGHMWQHKAVNRNKPENDKNKWGVLWKE